MTGRPAEDEALPVHHNGSLRRLLAGEESIEAAHRPGHLDSTELQSRIRRQRERENDGRRLDSE